MTQSLLLGREGVVKERIEAKVVVQTKKKKGNKTPGELGSGKEGLRFLTRELVRLAHKARGRETV